MDEPPPPIPLIQVSVSQSEVLLDASVRTAENNFQTTPSILLTHESYDNATPRTAASDANPFKFPASPRTAHSSDSLPFGSEHDGPPSLLPFDEWKERRKSSIMSSGSKLFSNVAKANGNKLHKDELEVRWQKNLTLKEDDGRKGKLIQIGEELVQLEKAYHDLESLYAPPDEQTGVKEFFRHARHKIIEKQHTYELQRQAIHTTPHQVDRAVLPNTAVLPSIDYKIPTEYTKDSYIVKLKATIATLKTRLRIALIQQHDALQNQLIAEEALEEEKEFTKRIYEDSEEREREIYTLETKLAAMHRQLQGNLTAVLDSTTKALKKEKAQQGLWAIVNKFREEKKVSDMVAQLKAAQEETAVVRKRSQAQLNFRKVMDAYRKNKITELSGGQTSVPSEQPSSKPPSATNSRETPSPQPSEHSKPTSSQAATQIDSKSPLASKPASPADTEQSRPGTSQPQDRPGSLQQSKPGSPQQSKPGSPQQSKPGSPQQSKPGSSQPSHTPGTGQEFSPENTRPASTAQTIEVKPQSRGSTSGFQWGPRSSSPDDSSKGPNSGRSESNFEVYTLKLEKERLERRVKALEEREKLMDGEREERLMQKAEKKKIKENMETLQRKETQRRYDDLATEKEDLQKKLKNAEIRMNSFRRGSFAPYEEDDDTGFGRPTESILVTPSTQTKVMRGFRLDHFDAPRVSTPKSPMTARSEMSDDISKPQMHDAIQALHWEIGELKEQLREADDIRRKFMEYKELANNKSGNLSESEMSQKITGLHWELGELKEELKASREQVAKQHETIVELKQTTKIDQLNTELELKKLEIKKLTRAHDFKVSEILHLKEELDAEKKAMIMRESEREEEKQQYFNTMKERYQLQLQLSKLTAENSELQVGLDHKRQAIQELQVEHERQIEQLRDAHNIVKENYTLREENDVLNKEVERLSAELDDTKWDMEMFIKAVTLDKSFVTAFKLKMVIETIDRCEARESDVREHMKSTDSEDQKNPFAYAKKRARETLSAMIGLWERDAGGVNPNAEKLVEELNQLVKEVERSQATAIEAEKIDWGEVTEDAFRELDGDEKREILNELEAEIKALRAHEKEIGTAALKAPQVDEMITRLGSAKLLFGRTNSMRSSPSLKSFPSTPTLPSLSTRVRFQQPEEDSTEVNIAIPDFPSVESVYVYNDDDADREVEREGDDREDEEEEDSHPARKSTSPQPEDVVSTSNIEIVEGESSDGSEVEESEEDRSSPQSSNTEETLKKSPIVAPAVRAEQREFVDLPAIKKREPFEISNPIVENSNLTKKERARVAAKGRTIKRMINRALYFTEKSKRVSTAPQEGEEQTVSYDFNEWFRPLNDYIGIPHPDHAVRQERSLFGKKAKESLQNKKAVYLPKLNHPASLQKQAHDSLVAV